MESSVARRLQSIANHTNSETVFGPRDNDSLVLVLADGGKVSASLRSLEGGKTETEITLNGSPILAYTISDDRSFAFDISSVGTQYQGATTHVPKYELFDLRAPKRTKVGNGGDEKGVSIPDIWAAIYALFTLYPDNEHIPFTMTSLANIHELTTYFLDTGLARKYPKAEKYDMAAKKTMPTEDILFLSRMSFWQGAGTTGFHSRGWLLNPKEPFPTMPSYTRTEKVIAMHPLRPSKPQPGEILYRRWCKDVKQVFEITYLDLEGVHDGSKALAGSGGISRHLAAFHKWHNDERVNTAWGEHGSLEMHRNYIEGAYTDPHVLPVMMSWDGELMGYAEITYIKENHVAQHYPTGVVPGDWERGLHVLVGESKFLGGGRTEIWMRSLVHYMFLADSRTDRVCGEPKFSNKAIINAGFAAGYQLETVFDFPYKRSALMFHPRERFFHLCRLR